mgnify:FL=1|tara:strand:+ start:241 stop:417 length:177 start_codon:yes stop_codon:yes gene_type:complete
MKKNKEHIKVCRCFDSNKFEVWQIREAVDISVGDDGNKSKEVIEILKTEKWDKYATIV